MRRVSFVLLILFVIFTPALAADNTAAYQLPPTPKIDIDLTIGAMYLDDLALVGGPVLTLDKGLKLHALAIVRGSRGGSDEQTFKLDCGEYAVCPGCDDPDELGLSFLLTIPLKRK